MLRRLIPAAVVGAVASLAFAGSALAAPSTPHLAPIPNFVCGSTLTMNWTASTPDPGAQVIAYRVDIGDLTAGTSSYKYVSGLSTTIGPLAANHHFAVRVRALELTSSHALVYSASSADSFVRSCLKISDEILNRYVAYNPWPGCIMCGLVDFFSDDPIMERQIAVATAPVAERIQGVQLAADGEARVIGG
jgi:hypothetical protein